MASETDRIRQEIAHTRQEIAQGVERLAERAKPGERVRRGLEHVKDGARAAADYGPKQVARAAQNSPVGVGLIAFGGGLLAAALIPESEAERRAARQLSENLGPVVEPLQEAGRAVVADVRESVGAAAEQVRTVAADAAAHTARDAADGGRAVVDQVRRDLSP